MIPWIEAAAALENEAELRIWVSRHPEHWRRESVEQLLAGVVASVHVDRVRASRLAEVARELAGAAGDAYSMALALRSSAAARYAASDYEAAIEDYSAALRLFEELGEELEIGKTLNSALQPLAYTGQQERAIEWGERARQIFARAGDELRLARLASNMANVLFRQDRATEALALYGEALVAFRRAGTHSDVAAALSNLAVCRTSLGEFAAAIADYEQARGYSERHGMTLLVAEADYNIAWLHYLRGDFLQAMELYALTRSKCREAGDLYHLALCDMDESEMYLQLNLVAEAGELARRAAEAFAGLGMGYERGKSLLNQALAETRPARSGEVEPLLREARSLFGKEGNRIWVALVDLHEAMLARRRGDGLSAMRLSRSARHVLAETTLAGKAALCGLLEAQLMLDRGAILRARETALQVRDSLRGSELRSQHLQASTLLAAIEESAGNEETALALLEDARDQIENLRNRVWGESSRIAFLKDKLAVYESLAHEYCRQGRVAAAFHAMEQAKSRGMAEMLASPGASGAGAELNELLKDLNASYRQIEIAALAPGSPEAEHVLLLRERAREKEREISRLYTGLRSDTMPQADSAASLSLEDIQRRIPEAALLIEYYEIRGVFHACLVSRKDVRILPVSEVSGVRSVFRFVELQIARMRNSGARDRSNLDRLTGSSSRAATRHLAEVYDALLRPVEEAMAGFAHLIVVPHGFLHEVPFHALFDGAKYLIDRFTVSYAPSASVFARCAARTSHATGGSLVLGVPDEQAPWIEHEARAVASCLPGSHLFLREEATESVLRNYGRVSRFLHIATHGIFRRDNPLFSAIRLGDSRLSLLELYSIPLGAELVTLSGCSTGLNAITGGDELLGLIRGLLGAGAKSVLASLWDVNDRSTTEFMISLYREIGALHAKPEAVRAAMLETRERHPHPYHWAPFILVGAL